MRCLVLTYHSHNIAGKDYGSNDHVALAADLELLREAAAEVMPLGSIADAVAAGEVTGKGALRVGLSFDDGPRFDHSDFEHPRFGPQRGFLNILRDFSREHGERALGRLHATSFVIASPEARACMEREVPEYPDHWLHDDWWNEAIASGLLDIGNHSWDHVHHSVPRTAAGGSVRDDFTVVDTLSAADNEIRTASESIAARTGRVPSVFAFPFGHVNRYLVDEYLPRHGSSFGLKAAFGTASESDEGSVWCIPRVVCGYDWRSPAEFGRLVAAH